MNGLLHVSSSPHARSKVTTDKIMFAVLLALAPAACVGVWNFGLRALLLIVISMAVCPLTEYLYEKGMKKPVTIADGSALVTGLLLAMNMPVQAPLWMPVIGGVFAILVVKQLFGGLGQNIMNPALAGRCFLLISFPGHMTNFAAPAAAHLVDTVSGATPLAAAKAGEQVNLLSMFLGNTAGTIGETSALCKMLSPVLLELAKEKSGTLKVGKVNVDEQMELAMRFQVSSIPMLVVFKDGKAVAKSVGYRPKSEITAMVEGAR